jgi:signal transduction protein with GAF and PtsI domain
VSKRHARLEWTGRGWRLADLGSKNGTTVNGTAPGDVELRDEDWISLGGLMGRFERLTFAQAAALESERLARLQTSIDLRRRLNAGLDPIDLLLRLLQSAMDVTGTERGFVLVADANGVLRAEVAAGFSAEDLRDTRFRGSVGAVRQTFETGTPLLIPDVQGDPRLARRPSVVANGISSMACVPLRHQGKALGVIYVDSRKLVPSFTELDLEILETLADHAANILASSLGAATAPQPGRTPNHLVVQLQRRIEELFPAV